jgi:hypothetical protein
MKLTNVTNVESFFEAVNKCQGDVYLTTQEGDRLNLKSQLTKFLTLSTVFQSSLIKEMNLELSNPQDVSVMLSFSMCSAA